MIVAELRYLKIRQDINVVAVPRYMLPSYYDKSFMDLFGKIPRVSESEVSEDGITFMNVIGLKMNPKFEYDDNKEYVILERTNNCQKPQLKNGVYEIPSYVTEDGVRALQEMKIKVKLYVHEDDQEVCEWGESKKEPQAFVFYWESKNWGFISGSGYIAYEAVYSRGRGHYLILLQNKEATLEFGEQKVKIRYSNRKVEYQVI